MEPRHLRPLLPARDASGETKAKPEIQNASHNPTKRKATWIACYACKSKKTACNGQQPKCSSCARRGVDCIYRRHRDARLSNLAGHSELFGGLLSLPEDEAINLLRRLRSAADLSAVLSSIQGSMHAKQRPSDLKASRSIIPPTNSNMEFELIARHPVMYPKLEPLSIALLNAFIESTVHNTMPRPTQPNTATRVLPDSSSQASSSPFSQPDLSALATVTGASNASWDNAYCDPRLDRLKIGYWTTVAIPDALAAAVLSFYLENDHPLLALFDASLFLDDLVGQRLTFCSALLVNALLYLSCQTYTRVNISSLDFVPELFDRARMLWEVEQNVDCITTVAAATILSLASQTNGHDKLGMEILMAGRRMAERLGLMNMPRDSPNIPSCKDKSPYWLRASSHIAWGTYNYLSLHGFYFRDPPILHPPFLPIPGEQGQGSDDVGSKTYLDNSQLPTYMGKTFPTLRRFWVIVQEVAALYLAHDGQTLVQCVPPAFIEAKYQKLLAWAETMTTDMARGDGTPAHVLIFHTIFHSIVLQIFYPFLGESASLTHQRLRSFSSEDSSPMAAFTASLNQLKRLLYLLQTQYKSATWSIILNPALVQVSDAMLSPWSHDEPGRRLYFSLCIRAYLDLYVSYPVFWDLAKGFLTRAMKYGIMSHAEAKRYLAEMLCRGRHHTAPDHATSSVIIDFDLAMRDPEAARTKAIAEQFDELAILDEFTTGEYSADLSDSTARADGSQDS